MKPNEYLNIARDEGVAEMISDIGKFIGNQRKRHGPDPEFDLMVMGAFSAIIVRMAYAKKDRDMLNLWIASLTTQQKLLLQTLDQNK